jgi:hypothetical protein
VRSVSTGLGVLASVVVLCGAAAIGCSATAVTEPWELAGWDDAGGSSALGDGAATTKVDSGGSQPGMESGSPDAGAGTPDASAPDVGAPDTGTVEDSSVPPPDTGTVTSADGFGDSRTACINKINALRATDTAVKLQPYTLTNDATTNSCVDTQASTDQSMNMAHYSFGKNGACFNPPGNGSGQNECLQGYGTSAAGVTQCLQDMWDERLQSNCTGCVGCTAFGGACANCDFYGMNGSECGHYVNMSAPYFTAVACGFAGAAPSSSAGWSVQNFE